VRPDDELRLAIRRRREQKPRARPKNRARDKRGRTRAG
jgi:hypothetical protein